MRRIFSTFSGLAPETSVAPIEPMENGILPVGSAHFRERCAVDKDGVRYIARGNTYDDELNAELHQLQEAGRIPKIIRTETRTLGEIANLYQSASQTGNAEFDAARTTAAVAKLNRALIEAAEAGASDLKIIQRDRHTDIRVKIASREYDLDTQWTRDEGRIAITHIFDKRDQGSAQVTMVEGEFQSFSVTSGKGFALPYGIAKLRGQKGYHETETGTGTHLIFRLIPVQSGTAHKKLEDLGFDGEVLEALRDVRAKLRGAVIIGGSTGDGKSTTLSCNTERLYDENDGRLSVVTLEDPVEFPILRSGVIQIPVASAGGAEERKANYRQALMHFVRANPDVGVISEIRDGDGAKEVLQFVASGHASYTTIHVDSALEIPFRLIDMGVPPEELAKPGGIVLLMKQTLVPILCPHCSEPVETTADLPLPMRGLRSTGIRKRNLSGCDHCTKKDGSLKARANAGYQSIAAVGEVIRPDEGFFQQIRRRDAFGALNYWLRPKGEGGLGGTTIGTKIARLVMQGQLDPWAAIPKGADFTRLQQPDYAAARVEAAE
ncbi:type II/IV secretion system protein [Thioclava sp. BHET1]|nr:type II/IV secretion system protein [Thioclava sp. BHET1]